MSRKVQVGCEDCGALFYANRSDDVVYCPKCGAPCEASDEYRAGFEE